MLNLNLLNNEVQQFINKHLNTPIDELALKGSPFDAIQTPELLEQIQAKKNVKKNSRIGTIHLGFIFQIN